MKITDYINGTCSNVGSGKAPPFSIVPILPGASINNGVVPTFEKPSTTFYRSFLVTGQSVIDYQSPLNRGDCQLGQIVVVTYTGNDPDPGDELGVKPDDWTANAGYPSCLECLMIVDSTSKLMLAALHPITSVVGIPTGDISTASSDGLTPGSATFKVCKWSGSAFSSIDNSYTVTGYNMAPMSFKSGNGYQLKIVNGIWLVDHQWAGIDNFNASNFQGLVNNSGAAKWDDPEAC